MIGRAFAQAARRVLRDHGGGYNAPAALLAQLVEHFHGKEGVIGSSPMEGSLAKALDMAGS